MKEALDVLKSQVEPLLQKTWELQTSQDRKMAILNNLTNVGRCVDDCLNQLRLIDAEVEKEALRKHQEFVAAVEAKKTQGVL